MAGRNAVNRIPPEFGNLLHLVLPKLQEHLDSFCEPNEYLQIFNMQPGGNFLEQDGIKNNFWCELEFDIVFNRLDGIIERRTTSCLYINFSTGAIVHPNDLPALMNSDTKSLPPDKLLATIPEMKLVLAWSRFLRSYNSNPQIIYNPIVECISFLEHWYAENHPANFRPLSGSVNIPARFLGTLFEANRTLRESQILRIFFATTMGFKYSTNITLFRPFANATPPQIPLPKERKRQLQSLDGSAENDTERCIRVLKRNGSL